MPGHGRLDRSMSGPDPTAVMAALSRAAELRAPWVSAYEPPALIRLARDAGSARAESVSGADWNAMYFANRSDDLRASSSELILVARVA
jgi:class 3 adenylate cyclase